VVDPSATVAQAPVITVIIDSATADGPRAPFELVEAAARTDPKNETRESSGAALVPACGRSTVGLRLGCWRVRRILDVPQRHGCISRFML
jgi:hypothetical protein